MSDPSRALLTATEGAEYVQVRVGTVRQWARRGLIVQWSADDLGRPLYLAMDLLEVERRTRREKRGRPRGNRVA